MSDSRESEPRDGREPEGPPEPHHGLVEEIKEEIQEVVEHVQEEIHEVVEHVPKPVRWTIRKIVLVGLASFIALIVIAVASGILYLANRTEWVASELTLILNQTLATRSDVVLKIDDLRGNLVTGVRVVHPVLRFRDDPDLPPILEAERLELRYSSWGILTGRSRPIVADLYRPVIQFTRGPDGKVRIPKWESKAGAVPVEKRRHLEFHVTLHDGKVQSPALRPSIEGLDAHTIVKVGQGTSVDVARLAWKQGPWDNPLRKFRGTLDAGDSVKVRVLELDSPELALSGTAAWKAGEKRQVVRATVDRVRWAWLAKVFDNGVFDVPGEATFVADAVNDQGWRGAFRASLTWNELPADGSGRFSYEKGRLAVAPLAATTPSGGVTGRFDMVGKGWVLDATARDVDPRAWKAFRLTGWPEGNLNGKFRMSQTERKDFHLDATLGSSVLAGWRADTALVWFHAPSATTDSFTVDFRRRGGAARLEAGTRPWGWLGQWTARDFPLEEWPDGGKSGLKGRLAEGRGNVVNRDGALDVTGRLNGTGSEWMGSRFAEWTLENVEGRLLPTPDLTAGVTLRDFLFLGTVHFDSTRAAIRLGDLRADLDTVAAWAGDTLVRVAGDAAWKTDSWNVRLARAEMKSSQFHWTAEPDVAMHGDPRGVVFDRVVAHDGDARFEARGRWAAQGGVYDFDAHATRLQIGRIGMPLAWQLEGEADTRLEVRGPNGNPQWSLDAEVSRPGQRGDRGDSLSLALDGARHRLDVRRLVFRVHGGEVAGSGRIEGTREPWPDTLTADGVLRWLKHAASWQGTARATELALADVDEVLPQPLGWAGRVTGDLTLAGRPSDPAFTARLDSRPFVWKEFQVDRLGVDASFAGERLKVGKLEMQRAGVVSTVSGSLPLHLALGDPAVVPERPIDALAQIPNGDFSIVAAFVPQIGWARGRFDLNATLAGTPKHPRFQGTMTVRDAEVRLAGREEMLEQVAADLSFDENEVKLDQLVAKQGRDGSVTAKGAIRLSGLGVRDYRFDLGLRNFSANETGLYAAQMDGDFVVTNGPRVRGVALPQVVGQVNLRRAAILFDFANQTETQQLAATTRPLYWTYRVKVDASRNLHWQPPDGDIEFSADLTLEQTADSLLIYGDLRAERGTYYFLDNRFTIQRADLIFDNESGVNPQLDIQATARVVPILAGNGDLASPDDRPHNVTVEIVGRADEPEISFSSDPPDWDEPTILHQLTIGRFTTEGKFARQSIEHPLDHYLTRAINRTMSAEVSRAFRGYINEWALEREQGGLLRGEGSLMLGVGTQLTSNFSLRYREALPGLTRSYTTPTTEAGTLFQRQVQAEYRLNRFFYLTTELAQRRGTTAAPSTTGPDINFNLKARWEY